MSSSLLGPVLGGFFAEHLHWSVIFWINLPLGALAFWMTQRGAEAPAAPRPPRTGSTCSAPRCSWRRPIALLLALELGRRALSLALGADRSASSPARSALWALFALRLRTAREPLIPLDDPAQPGRAHGHARGLLRHGHLYRAHDLPAGLFRGGARPLGEQFRARPHPAHGRHGDRRHHLGARHGERHPLQAPAGRRACSSRWRRPACSIVSAGRLSLLAIGARPRRRSASASGPCCR